MESKKILSSKLVCLTITTLRLFQNPIARHTHDFKAAVLYLRRKADGLWDVTAFSKTSLKASYFKTGSPFYSIGLIGTFV
jgi:hypothetical protein